MILKNAVFIFILLLLLFIILNLTSYSLLGYVGIVYFYFFAIIYVSVYLGLKFLIRELVFFLDRQIWEEYSFCCYFQSSQPEGHCTKTISSCGSDAPFSKWWRCSQPPAATTKTNWIKSYIVDPGWCLAWIRNPSREV